MIYILLTVKRVRGVSGPERVEHEDGQQTTAVPLPKVPKLRSRVWTILESVGGPQSPRGDNCDFETLSFEIETLES